MEESPLTMLIIGLLIGFVLGIVVSSFTGLGGRTRGVLFERDQAGRIVAIHGYR